MKRKRKKNRVYIIAVMIALAVTPWATQHAGAYRGYDAVGGEFLLIPLAVLLARLSHDVQAVSKSRHGKSPLYRNFGE